MTKILIDEAVVRQALEALERMKGYGDVFLYRSHEQKPYDQVCDAATTLRQALADAALDKMADNARELGLSYEQPAPVQDDHFAGGGKPMAEQPAQQEPDPDELTIAYMSGVYEGKKAERQRIVNLLMIQHEAAKGAHNYWHVAANLIQAEVASDT